MENLYVDTVLATEYHLLIDHSSDTLKVSDQTVITLSPEDRFYEKLTKQVYTSLQSVSTEPLPKLHIHALLEDSDTLSRLDAETMFTDRSGVHAGLNLVSKLDGAIIVLTAFLMENYLWQISPFVVAEPPPELASISNNRSLSMYSANLSSIADTVSLEDFPKEALGLYAAHLIPEAEARDGYRKRPFQLIMEHLQAFFAAQGKGDGERHKLSRAIPKPMLDIKDFLYHFDANLAIQAYKDPENGPYLLRLHLQLLLDGLYFILAHEAAHFQLGHLEHREKTVAQMRKQEGMADASSLALLRMIPGFQPRSLVILFSFASSEEPDLPPDRMDHPFARNRLLVLAQSILAGPGGDALRSDVNAGMALLPTPPEPYYLTFGWPDEAPEDVEIYITTYADMDYTAHLMVYIDRPPRSREGEAPLWENAFLLAHIAYKIWFEVRDPVNPEKVYAWGGAGYHPTIRPEDMFTSGHGETVFSRLHLSIPAPAEFCIKWPSAEFAVTKIEIFSRPPDTRSREEGRKAIRFFYEPIELNLSDWLKTLLPPEKDQTLIDRLLLAARRFEEYGRGEESIQIYQWLYQKKPDALLYGDLVALAYQLTEIGKYSEAAHIAQREIKSSGEQRPGFHYIMALNHDKREEAQEAYEEMFLEMNVFGEYGEMFEQAQKICAKIASYPNDAVMVALRAFINQRNEADRAIERGDQKKALFEFHRAKETLLTAQKKAMRDFVFLHQLYSDVTLTIAEMEGDGFEAATEVAHELLERWPNFVPALMNLARISMLKGEKKTAYAYWKKAHAVSPFHSIVFNRRKEYEDELL